jgi:uncharacterized iron-regulated membrane protein
VQSILRRPPTVFLRRVLFQLHLWVGVLAGLYIFIVSVTGAALVFRIDMQRALHPHLFTPGVGTPADAATILDRVRDAFPHARVSGIDAPTTLRPTYLAYVVNDDGFETLLVDPVSGRVLGELPDTSVVRTIQDLHFNLLAGRTGRVVNGIGAMLLLVLCLTGVVIWWPGTSTWRRGVLVDFRRPWKRVTRELHMATGFWMAIVLIMWAVTGIYFAFPSQFRAAVNYISPLTITTTPQSNPTGAGGSRPTWRALIAAARNEVPARHVARVVLPANHNAAVLVMFSDATPTPAGGALTSVYLDQYTGAVLGTSRPASGSTGDAIVAWIVPLHIGNFGGDALRAAWLILGLSPALLVVTGLTMWWTRVVRPRWAKVRARN